MLSGRVTPLALGLFPNAPFPGNAVPWTTMPLQRRHAADAHQMMLAEQRSSALVSAASCIVAALPQIHRQSPDVRTVDLPPQPTRARLTSEVHCPRGAHLCGGGVLVSKKLVVMAALCAIVALGACRRETPYVPMKLGASTTTAQPAQN